MGFFGEREGGRGGREGILTSGQDPAYGNFRKAAMHLLLPWIAPAAIVCLYFTPKDVFGCANRGLMALGVAFLAMAGAAAAAMKGVKEKNRGDREAANLWIVTTLILLLPIILLIGPLG